jgi:hypothetical protein
MRKRRGDREKEEEDEERKVLTFSSNIHTRNTA